MRSELSGIVELLEMMENKIRNRGNMTTLALAAGILFDREADLADKKVRERLSASAIKAFVKIADEWRLKEAKARKLLGGKASSTYHQWKNDPQSVTLDQDTLTRISLLIGIYKASHIYFGEDLANRWVTLGNRGSMFSGNSPVEYMIHHGQPGMFQVRQLLDAWRGGR